MNPTHVVIVNNLDGDVMLCQHCGTCVRVLHPVTIDSFVKASNRFIDAHKDCTFDSLDKLVREIRDWQKKTFPNATPASITEHLRREALELAAAPDDIREQADVFLLLASSCFDLVGSVRKKFEENKLRVWGKPDAAGVVEHVRDGEA